MTTFQLSAEQLDAVRYVGEIPRGEIRYLIGRAGTGKTSVLREICRRYDCEIVTPTLKGKMRVREITGRHDVKTCFAGVLQPSKTGARAKQVVTVVPW